MNGKIKDSCFNIIALTIPYLWPAIWVLPPWQWRQRWGLRQRSGIVVPFSSSCSTMAPRRRGGGWEIFSALNMFANIFHASKVWNYVTQGKGTITPNWDLRSTMMAQKGALIYVTQCWQRKSLCWMTTDLYHAPLQWGDDTLSLVKMSTVTAHSCTLCSTQKKTCASSSSSWPTLGLVQPSVGGPGPFSEGIPLLSGGRGGQIFTGRGSLPFLFVSCQNEDIDFLISLGRLKI